MSNSETNVRDRLGLWGLANDTEVAGAVSGLERIKNPRYNKVRNFYRFKDLDSVYCKWGMGSCFVDLCIMIIYCHYKPFLCRRRRKDKFIFFEENNKQNLRETTTAYRFCQKCANH